MRAILLNRILLVLAFAGLYVAGVLSMGHLMGADVPCGGSNECAVVANHPASKIFNVPVAYLGFLAYVGLAIVAAMRAGRGMRNSNGLVMAGYGLSAFGTVFSLYLQYQSFTVIHAKCLWCIASAAIMVLSLIGHAVLAQLSEQGVPAESHATKLDSAMLAALPLALIVGLGWHGATMVGGGKTEKPRIVLGKDVYEKLMAGELNSIGPKDAKVTIVEFADLQCSACQTHSPMVKGFAQEYPDKVRLVFRHFPLDKKHQWAMPAAAVAEYAAEKGKFWDFIREVMALNRELEGPDELYAIAKTVGLNVEDLQKRMTNPEDKAYKDVVKDMNLAGELGIVYTPTFFIVSDGGNSVEVTTSKDVLETLNSPKYKKIING